MPRPIEAFGLSCFEEQRNTNIFISSAVNWGKACHKQAPSPAKIGVEKEKVREATRLIKLCKEKLYKVDEEVKKVLEELDV